MSVAIKAYYGICLSIGISSSFQLIPALGAYDSSILGLLQNVGMLQIQSDDVNGANPVYVGDSLINASATPPRYAYKLLVHEANPYRSPEAMQVPLGDIWAQCPAATSGSPMQINVEVIPC